MHVDRNDQADVRFPRVSQVIESRRDLVKSILDNFNSEIGNGPILLVSGKGPTRAYAEVYKNLIEKASGIAPKHRILDHAPDEQEAVEVATEVAAAEERPTLIVYVGGQTVGDATKVIAHRLREMQAKKKENSTIFGGIITSLSNDGVFSVTASVRDSAGLPKTFATVAPDFVVGHRLTLLRQPYEMKISCVGDILSKISSLWDYNYSCRVLEKYHNDFAADLTKTAYEIAKNPDLTRRYLHEENSIGDLYRSVQLCGLSMQLTKSSETCSGAEHVGQKWIDEFITRYNRAPGRHKPLRSLAHGQAVLPTTLVALQLQGQSSQAADVRAIARRLGLEYKVRALGLPATVMQAALALGLGYRCPKYLAHVLAKGDLPKGDQKERVTILEEIEAKVLPHAIKTAMIDAKVATIQDFEELSGLELITMQKVLDRAFEHTEKQFTDNGLPVEAKTEVLHELSALFGELVPHSK